MSQHNGTPWQPFQDIPISLSDQDTSIEGLAKFYARTFSTHDGEHVLSHLRGMTRERTLGPEVPDSVLRYVEGQRRLVAYIERLIERGRD